MSYAPHWDPTYHHVVIWEAIEDEPVKGKPRDPEETPRLNREQRRHLRRYITHKACLQLRHVYKKYPGLRTADIAKRKEHCRLCGQAFLGGSGDRCGCKVVSNV